MAGLLLALAAVTTGCSIIYSEVSTPVRNPTDAQALEPAPPSDIFYITVKSARIPTKTRDGRSWDKVGGSAPDVYAVLFIDQVEVARTVVVPNSFEPTWIDSNPTNYKLSPSAEVRVEVWDENPLVSHPICNQVIKDIADAASIGTVELNCDSGASLVVVVAEPKAKIGFGFSYEVRGKEAFVTRVIAASSAGRAGIRPDEQIVRVQGKSVASLTHGELESILNAKSRGSVLIEVRGEDGEVRKLELREEAMYPVDGEGIKF